MISRKMDNMYNYFIFTIISAVSTKNIHTTTIILSLLQGALAAMIAAKATPTEK